MIEDDAALRMLSGLESSCLAVLTLADGRAVTEADLHACLCLGQDRTLYVCVCVCGGLWEDETPVGGEVVAS